MTYEDFLAKLRETPRTWELRPTGSIRSKWCECPLEAVSVEMYHDWEHADLVDWRDAVVCAADGSPSASPAVLRDLLVACGLQEQSS